jgi:ABC-type phosphate/phosphonate transport system ATPase subunit
MSSQVVIIGGGFSGKSLLMRQFRRLCGEVDSEGNLLVCGCDKKLMKNNILVSDINVNVLLFLIEN